MSFANFLIAIMNDKGLKKESMDEILKAQVQRVEEFKFRVQGKDSDKFSLLGLAYECGFNSKSTFNYTFKKFTGKTPKEFFFRCKIKSERKHSDDC
jgi:AraC-like DNA-binding protein